MAHTKPDVIKLTYEEAEILEFLAECFLDDNAGDSSVFSKKREKYGRKVVAKLANFTNIDKRCGVIGIKDSSGDRPRCRLRPHSKATKHRSLDLKTMKPLAWFGDKADEYFKEVTGKG